MTKKEYEKLKVTLDEGALYLPEDINKVVDSDDGEIMNEFFNRIDGTLSMNNNREMTESILKSLQDHFPLWEKELSVRSILINLSWVNAITRKLGSNKHIQYPEWDDFDTENADPIYIKAMLPQIYDLFVKATSTILEATTGYIFDKKYVKMIGDKLVGLDGSYYSLDDGKVRYGETPIEPMDLPVTAVDIDYMIKSIGYDLKDNDIGNVINLLIDFSVATTHNANVNKLTHNNSYLNLDPRKLLPMSDDFGIDLDKSAEYLRDLANSMHLLCKVSREELSTNDHDIFNVDFTKFEYVDGSLPRIENIDPDHGLELTLRDNMLRLVLGFKDGTTVRLMKIELTNADYSKCKSEEFEVTLFNLCMGTGNRLGSLLVNVLNTVRLLDYFMQPPLLSDISVREFLTNSELRVYGNTTSPDGDNAYIITENKLLIGFVEGYSFVIILVITTNDDTNDFSPTLLFRNSPPVKKLDKQAIDDLKEAFSVDKYKIIEDKLKLK